MAHGTEPNPPALETEMANALPCTPAMGAWMMGNSILRRACRVIIGPVSYNVSGTKQCCVGDIIFYAALPMQSTGIRVGDFGAGDSCSAFINEAYTARNNCKFDLSDGISPTSLCGAASLACEGIRGRSN